MAPGFEGLVMELERKHYPPGPMEEPCWLVQEVCGLGQKDYQSRLLEEGEFALEP